MARELTGRSSAIARKADDEGTILREATLASGYIGAEEFDRIVNPAAMVGSAEQRGRAESIERRLIPELRARVRFSSPAPWCDRQPQAGDLGLCCRSDSSGRGARRTRFLRDRAEGGGMHVRAWNAREARSPHRLRRGTVPVGEVSEEDWDAVLRTNVTGVWLAVKHEIAHMKENGGGVIVNVSSNLGAHLRIPNAAAYITSKAAVSALTRAAALDHIHQGIRINAVSPGASAAPMSLRPGETEADRTERVKSENPLGRVAEAEEVAAAVLYLASPMAGAVVGTDLVVDSGSSA
ncbi:SDR family oxidoreductase [Streptomyces sp. NPDC097727]|uniref:SDR family NAD(P)-dependent oxidoreductase n=1 Tax=Streptomyces sp. NPDC097727 TaxID=3366092 RepID=UPI00381400DD